MFNLAFVGFGTVGQGLARLLSEKRAMLKERYGMEYRVVAISDAVKGSIYNENGLDLPIIMDLASKNAIGQYPQGTKGLDGVETIRRANADVIVEVTPTNIQTGEPGITHVREALSRGKHVVTTNKGPIALAYRELSDLARSHGACLRFEGTVMSGTPVLNLARDCLAGCEIAQCRGILNGTTNYMLTQMEHGREYDDVLADAQRRGYAEADPTNDVAGYDALAKTVILANVVLGGDLRPKEVPCEGITKITKEDVVGALRKGRRIKLIGQASTKGGEVVAEVSPQELPLTDPLANIEGVLNAITLKTDATGDVTVVGPGAGGRTAGYALLSDLLSISGAIGKSGCGSTIQRVDMSFI